GKLADPDRLYSSRAARRLLRKATQRTVCLSSDCCHLPRRQWDLAFYRGNVASSYGKQVERSATERAGGAVPTTSFLDLETSCCRGSLPVTGSHSWHLAFWCDHRGRIGGTAEP